MVNLPASAYMTTSPLKYPGTSASISTPATGSPFSSATRPHDHAGTREPELDFIQFVAWLEFQSFPGGSAFQAIAFTNIAGLAGMDFISTWRQAGEDEMPSGRP